MKLTLEKKPQKPQGVFATPSGATLMITPPLGDDNWHFRVKVSEGQAVVAFHKFGTLGIGFAVEEEDWNTNLPYSCDTMELWNHIKKNKGNDSIPDERCIEAIKMLQAACKEEMEPNN